MTQAWLRKIQTREKEQARASGRRWQGKEVNLAEGEHYGSRLGERASGFLSPGLLSWSLLGQTPEKLLWENTEASSSSDCWPRAGERERKSRCTAALGRPLCSQAAGSRADSQLSWKGPDIFPMPWPAGTIPEHRHDHNCCFHWVILGELRKMGYSETFPSPDSLGKHRGGKPGLPP